MMLSWGVVFAEGHLSEQDPKIPRSWQEIAAELSGEQDPKRALQLSKELNAALVALEPKPLDPSKKPASRS